MDLQSLDPDFMSGFFIVKGNVANRKILLMKET